MQETAPNRILIVDDEEALLKALVNTLRERGYETTGFTSGIAALAAMRESKFDLLLSDIMMPEMDGITAMREIRKRPEWKKLPIIALTAKAMKDDQEKCLAAGANDYIAKPLDVEKLLSLVRVWMPK